MDSKSEAVFRIAVTIVYFGGWILVRLYFQWRLGSVEKTHRQNEGRERLAYAAVSLAAVPVLFYVSTTWLDSTHLVLSPLLRWAGFAIAAVGSFVLIWTHTVLGKNWSGVLELSKDHALVKEGPYRLVRHPMYSAFFLMGLGILLCSANWIVGGVLLGSVTFMYIVRVSDEEKMMLDQFGEAYGRYMNDTGRIVPKFW